MRARYGVDAGPALAELERAGELVLGELRPLGTQREWCDPEVLRRLRRASLAVLRKEIEPVGQATLARFAPAWQGVDRHAPAGAGVDRLRDVLASLQGLPLAPELWEKDVLPRRLGTYSPYWLDELCANGEVVWVGAGPLGGRSGRVALYFRDDAPLLGPPPAAASGRAARSTSCSASGWPRRLLLLRPARRVSRPGRRGAARGALGPRLGGGGDQRRVRAAALARRQDAGRGGARPGAPPRGAFAAAPAGRRRCRAGGRWPRTCSAPARPTRRRGGVPGRSSCSSATACSRASWCAPRATRAASRPSTRRCRRSRPSASPAAATSSRASAAPSSRCRAPSSGSARRRRRRRPRSSSPPPTRRSSTAPACAGRTPRCGRRHGAPARTWSRSAGVRRCRCTPAAARCASSAARTTSSRRSTPWPPPSARRRLRRLAWTRIDGEPAVASPLPSGSSRSASGRGLHDFALAPGDA